MDIRKKILNTVKTNDEIGTGILEDEFNRPVESIMRCDDFKSNFARRLSNRYISRPPVAPRLESPSNLKPLHHAEDISKTVPTPPESQSTSTPISMNNTLNNGEASPAPKPAIRSSISSSVIRQTNMEVETLRWQLAQTEGNRQMHIALLKQIVNFLNRVKDHISQKGNEGRKESLPRSRSVVHVNKNMEYSLSPPKKMSTKKISKSISNVNGYKELWNQTRTTVESAEKEAAQKISEEMSRLITLATTVLGTDLPDLACSCHDAVTECKEPAFITNIADIERDHHIKTDYANGKDIHDLDETDVSIVDSVEVHEPMSNDTNNESDKASAEIYKLTESIIDESLDVITIPVETAKSTVDKRSSFTAATFIEDESGFSSMSSFQEIGIPIINILAPSPCKENRFTNDITDILATEKWKNSIDISKQPLKVFWV